ncbi:MAG: MFS transporter [Corynebacterium sp.]|nr:MFS transporter [Corynebacterium sp.]
MSTRTTRLDELPVTRKHVRLLGISGIGWALDAMDIGLISFIMAALTVHWGLSQTEVSLLGSIGFLGMALGATLGGLLADRFGRRSIFALSMLVYGLATGASALSISLAMLLVLRFIVGLGLGAELPVASTYISEFSPRKVRGRMVVILEAFWAVGWILAAIIGATVVTSSEDGWRWALALGTLPALYSMVVRRGLPESVRYLELRGKHEEAERTVREFEASAEPAPQAAETKTPNQHTQPAHETNAHSIWSPRLRKRTFNLWTIWFCMNLAYYGAFIWIPSILLTQGYDLVRSFQFTLIITLAQLPGYACAAYLIEHWGRRNTLTTFLVGSAISAACYGLADSPTTIIIAGCFLSFFNLGAWGALYAVGPELYPTQLRGSGTGAAAGFGRIASIIAPLIVPPMLALGGTAALFALFGTAFTIAALAAWLLPENKDKALT